MTLAFCPPRGLTAVIMLALAACGGGSIAAPPPPPPSPVVALVEVSPASASLGVGDSLLLTAVARDQAGSAVGGRTPTWSSSAPTVATISAGGVVKAVGAGSATLTATIDGRSGESRVTVSPPAPLDIDAARSVSDSIGPRGGTLTATGANGVSFSFVVPPRALGAMRRITMTPVKSMGRLPFSGGLEAAVDLQPAGLKLAVAGRLTIRAPGPRPTGFRLVGFSYQGQADSLAPVPVADSGSSVTLLVTHFSGAGAGFGTTLEIQTFYTPGSLTAGSSQFYLNQLLMLAANSPRDFLAELQVMKDWMANAIIPAIQNSTNDFGLVVAMSEYGMWLETPIFLGVTGASGALSSQRQAAAAAAAPRLRQAIAGNNAICSAGPDLSALTNVLFWQTQAAELGIDTPLEQLDRRTVLAGLCGQVILSQVAFPANPPANQSSRLDVQAGFRWGADPNLDFQPFSWQVDIQGSTSDGTRTGLADPQGRLFLQITPDGVRDLVLLVTVCLFNPRVPYDDVCASQTVVRNFGVVVNGSVTVQTVQGLASLSNVSEITGDLTIVNVPTTDLHELARLRRIGGALLLTRMPSLTTLTGLAQLSSLGGLGLSADTLLDNVDGLERILSLDRSGLVIQGCSLLRHLGGLRGLATVSGITLTGNARLANIQALRGITSLVGDLTIGRNPLLPDLSDLNALVTVSGSVLIQGATPGGLALTGLTGLKQIGVDFTLDGTGAVSWGVAQSVTAVGRSLTVFSRSFARVADLAFPALKTVGRDLVFDSRVGCSGPSLKRRIAFPALTTVRSVDQVVDPVGATGCQFDLALPSLTTGLTLNADELSGLTLGPVARLVVNGTGVSTITDLNLSGLGVGTSGGQVGFVNLSKLKTLAIDNSQIADLSVGNASSLVSFSLSSTVMSQIALAALPSLTALSASASTLTCCGRFSGLSGLTTGQIVGFMKALGRKSGELVNIDGVLVPIP